MAIKIDGNFVCIGGFCFCETPTGIQFDGEAQSTLFCDTRGFQGEVSGYIPGSSGNDTIEKFPFSSDTNSTDVGELTQARAATGQSSNVSGYSSGGSTAPSPSNVAVNTIDKFPFSSDTNASDVGNLFQAKANTRGQSSKAQGFGYTSGGYFPTITTLVNTIDKFPFAADTNGTDVGELTQARRHAAGQSSTESGYTSGGRFPSPSGQVNTIDKFPFSTDAPATDVGNLTVSRGFLGSGQSSTTHGYSSGGFSPSSNVIDKFSFAADGNATDVGNLTLTRLAMSEQSSTTFGYSSGGTATPAPVYDVIDKHPFSSDTNATDVGELLTPKSAQGGQQI